MKRTKNNRIHGVTEHFMKRLKKSFAALIIGLPLVASGATNVRLELVEARFTGDFVAGSVSLREADTGSPITNKQVSIKLTASRDVLDWQHYQTDANGAVRFVLRRLRDLQGNFYDTFKFIAEFNIPRTSSDPGRQLYSEYRTAGIDQTVPYGGVNPPVAVIGPPLQYGAPVSSLSVENNVDLRFESRSYASDSTPDNPNYHIEDWYWLITGPAGVSISDNGPAVNFRPSLMGNYSMQLVVWDHNGRVNTTTAEFVVVAQKALRIESLGNSLLLSLPRTAPTLILEHSTTLGAAWLPVGSEAQWTTNADRVTAILPANGLSGFFRVRSP